MRTAAVSYRDLDLRSEAGIGRLNQRIHAALNMVCGESGTRDLAARGQALACRKAAKDRATASVQLAVAAARSDTQLAGVSAPAIRISAR